MKTNAASVALSLVDKKGNIVTLGDKIAIHFERREIFNDHQDIVFLEKIVYGRLHFRLSKGIGFIFDDVEYLETDDNKETQLRKKEGMRTDALKYLTGESTVIVSDKNKPTDAFYHEKGKFYMLRVKAYNWFKI